MLNCWAWDDCLWGYKTDPKGFFFSLLITKDVSLLLNASTKTKVEKTMLKE